MHRSAPLTSQSFPTMVRVVFAGPSTRTLAMLALVGANAIWGASAVASKTVLTHVPPLTLATLRVAIALAVLWPLVARLGGRPARGGSTALLGLTGVAGFCLFQNVGLLYTSATTTALINGGIPALTALLATLFLGERLSERRVGGLLLASGGVASLALLGTEATFQTSAISTVFPIASALSFAAYAVLGRRAFSSANALAIVAGSTRYGLFFLLPGTVLELATVRLGPLTFPDVLLLLYLGAGCSALAFVLCGYGLARLEAGQGAVFGNLKPLVGVALAVLLLGESLTMSHLIGGSLVLFGVVLTNGITTPHKHKPGKRLPNPVGIVGSILNSTDQAPSQIHRRARLVLGPTKTNIRSAISAGRGLRRRTSHAGVDIDAIVRAVFADSAPDWIDHPFVENAATSRRWRCRGCPIALDAAAVEKRDRAGA